MPRNTPDSIRNAPQVRIELNGKRLTTWEGLTIQRALDQAADGFAFSVPWAPTADNLERWQPYRWQEVKIFSDEELLLTGYVEVISNTVSEGQRVLQIEGRSVTGTLVDNAAGPPFELAGLTFDQIARRLSRPYGVLAYAVPDTGILGTVEIEPGDTVWSVLSPLAAANGLRARALEEGTLQFTRFDISGRPVAELNEGQSPVRSVATTHDSTRRFFRYTVLSQASGNPETSAVVEDPGVPVGRFRAKVIEPRQQSANVREAALYARARALLESYSNTTVVDGWTYGGSFWGPGGIVLQNAPSAFVVQPSRLLIQSITMTLDENGGQQSTLNLVLPESMTNTLPTEVPWSE